MTNREIDALCAEKVMGWKWRTRRSDMSSWLLPPSVKEVHQVVGPFGEEEIPGSIRKDVRWCLASCYSTDPEASKQLRDKMRADGYHYSVEWEAPGFDASFIRPTEEGFNYTASRESEEMAVALAALRAKGVEI